MTRFLKTSLFGHKKSGFVPAVGEIFPALFRLISERGTRYLLTTFLQVGLLIFVCILGFLYVTWRWNTIFLFRGVVELGVMAVFFISLFLIVAAWGQAAKLTVLLSSDKKKLVNWWRTAWGKTWSLVWTQFLLGCFLAGIIFFALVIPFWMAGWSRISELLILLLPFIIATWGYSLFFTFVPYVVVAEEKRGYPALERSFQLIAGRFWPLLGRLALLLALQLLILSAASSSWEADGRFAWISVLLGIALGFIGRALPLFYLTVLYRLFKKTASNGQSSFAHRRLFLAVTLGALVIAAGLLFRFWPVASGLFLENQLSPIPSDFSAVVVSGLRGIG